MDKKEEELLVDSKKDYSYELTLNDLAKSGRYDLNLIKYLKRGDMSAILLYTKEPEREDRTFMEPLLYAVKHDLNTYEVFKYCNEKLQRDVAREVIKEEPELIAETPLCKDVSFILKNAKFAPEIVRYADESVFEDSLVVYSLCLVSKRVASEVLSNTKADIRVAMGEEIQETYGTGNFKLPALSNDRNFISAAIQEKGADFLRYASEEIKNDFNFLREQAENNSEVIDYVVDHLSEFGKESIEAVREVSKDLTVNDIINNIETDDPVFQALKDSIEKRGKDNPSTVREVTAYLAKEDLEVRPETLNNIINYSLLTMETYKRKLEAHEIEELTLEDLKNFVQPSILNRLKEKMELQGMPIDEKTQQRIEECSEFYRYCNEMFKQKRKEDIEANIKRLDSDMTVEELERMTEENETLVKAIAGMYLKLDNQKPETAKKIIDCYFIKSDKIKKSIETDGFKLNERDGTELLPYKIMIKYKTLLEEKGMLDEETKSKIEEYVEFCKKCEKQRIAAKEDNQDRVISIVEKANANHDEKPLIDRFSDKLNYALNIMHNVEKNVDENGNIIISENLWDSLPRSSELVRMKKALGEQGILLTPEMAEKLETYVSFRIDYQQKIREVRKQHSKALNFEELNSLIEEKEISKELTQQELLKALESESPEIAKFRKGLEDLRWK